MTTKRGSCADSNIWSQLLKCWRNRSSHISWMLIPAKQFLVGSSCKICPAVLYVVLPSSCFSFVSWFFNGINEGIHFCHSSVYVVDAIYDTLQPTGQVAAAEMVRCIQRQDEEEDRSWAGVDRLGSETKNVKFHWMERHEDCLQKVLYIAP